MEKADTTLEYGRYGPCGGRQALKAGWACSRVPPRPLGGCMHPCASPASQCIHQDAHGFASSWWCASGCIQGAWRASLCILLWRQWGYVPTACVHPCASNGCRGMHGVHPCASPPLLAMGGVGAWPPKWVWCPLRPLPHPRNLHVLPPGPYLPNGTILVGSPQDAPTPSLGMQV